jgi:hypothetical protein
VRLALVIALALGPVTARAATPLCLEVRADADAAGVRKLVEDELMHHPTHRLVAAGCASQLAVELFSVAGTRYLTARVNQEVPVRFAVKGARELEERLADALRQVLGNDPVYLAEDLSRLNAVWRSGTNLLVHGNNRYRLELFELVLGSSGVNAMFASGGAFTVARGLDHVQVFARLELAGARFLRFYGFDVDVYVQAHFPFYKTHDPDSPLVDSYTPYAMIGLGVGF